jgi:transcription elongation factor GreA
VPEPPGRPAVGVPTGADLLRAIGLLADGPVGWDRPVPATSGGVYVVELGAPLATAPVDIARVGKWLERVPGLRLDGVRPTSKALAGRLASYWLADQVVVFIGSTSGSIGGRIAALRKTPLGDRRPYAGGLWLATLQPAVLSRTRLWWATTDAVEEYEDALLEAFSAAVGPDGASTPEPGLVLPWAVLRRPTGERRGHGISGALLPELAPAPAPGTTIRELPPEPDPAPRTSVGGVRPAVPPPARPPTPAGARGRGRPASSGRTAGARSGRTAARSAGSSRQVAAVELSADGHERLQAELHELRADARPAAIRRVASAREHGDLRENAEYHAAREELGFIEGRIQALEGRLRRAVIVEAAATGIAGLGSTVVVETDGEAATYRLVSSHEADPTAGRISTSSPVGRALVGHVAGDDVAVRMPSGTEVRYRVVSVG